MGLNHIKVSFELGLWRGKPRRIPTEVALVFHGHGRADRDSLIAHVQRTHTDVVLRCNQFSLTYR